MAKLPLTNISTSLVATTIGVATQDVGGLCSHPNVNKWSRYKPVNGPYEHPTCGFLIGSTNLPLPDDLRADAWVYDKPTGGELAPYRLGDFRGYDHSIRFQDQPFGVTVDYPTIGGTMYISCAYGQNANNSYASPRYMSQFADYYMGVSVYKGNLIYMLDHVISKCSSAKVGAASGDLITIDTSTLAFASGQIYMIIPFLSQYSFPVSTGIDGGAGNYLKYSLNALGADSATIRKNIGTPTVMYYFSNYVIQQLGGYGFRVSARVNSNYEAALSPAPVTIEMIGYSDYNGSGAIVTSLGPTTLGYYSFPPFGYHDLPSTDIGWGVSGSVRSVAVRYMISYVGDWVNYNLS